MPRSPLKLAIALAVVTATASGVVAQHQIQDGRRLDNNLQVGSGGINPATPQPDFRARNNVITGNVTGLGYFHGSVPYRADGEFGGSTPSDRLFRWRAVSWSPALLPPGAAVPSNLGSPANPLSVYGTFAPTMAGQLAQPGVDPRQPYRPFDATFQSTQAYAHVLERLNEQRARREPGAINFGVVQQPDGRLLELQASPLMGVYTRPRPDAKLPPLLNANRPTDASKSGDAQEPGRGSTDISLETGAGPVPGAPSAPAGGAPVTPAVPPAIVRPSLDLGRQLQTYLPPERDGFNVDQRVAALRTRILGDPATAPTEPGQDPYLDILAQIRAAEEGGAAARLGPQPPPLLQPPKLAPPTPQQLEKARLDRVNASRRARGLPPVAAPGAADAAEDSAASEAARKLVDALGRPRPRLGSLSGTRQDRVTSLMQQAESELATGKFFDAESHYRDALEAAGEHPLAHVGLVHAQLGAGLIRSASVNLRLLFERHPELIATRYEARLLPPAPRLQWVRSQLEEMIRTSRDTAPPIMIAYLGHQAASDELVRFGLDVAEARDPEDPLVPLLRAVWLRAAAASAPPATTRPTPSGGDEVTK